MKARYINLFLLAIALSITACDNGTTPLDNEEEEPVPTRELSISKSETSIENDAFEGRLGSFGRIRLKLPAGSNQPLITATYSSIWIYAEIDQPRLAISHYGPVSSNLALNSSVANVDPGVYSITADSIVGTITNWPAELGAPSMADGQPRLLGDRMMWGHYVPFQSETDPTQPLALTDIHIGISLYMFDNSSDENLLFVRYDLKNRGDAVINDVRVGNFADIDIHLLSLDSCPQMTSNDNAAAYDEDLGMAYAYQSPASPDAAGVDPSCLGYAVGYLFLDGPVDPASPFAHLAIRRWSDDELTGLYEGSFTEAIHFGRLLQGRNIYDDPIIDPTTGMETRYAFSGDPVAGTGWIEDEPQDVRSLLSLRPFSLAPNETTSVTLAWIVVEGEPDFESAIEALRSQAQTLRANPAKYLD